MSTDGDIKYEKFTDAELLEARQLINTRSYPLNSSNLRAEIASRNILSRSSLPRNTSQFKSLSAPSKEASLETIILVTLFSFVVLIIGGYSLITKGEFPLPTHATHDVVFGLTAKVFYIFVFIAFVMNCIKLYSLLNFNSNDNKLFRVATSVTNLSLVTVIVFCVISWVTSRA